MLEGKRQRRKQEIIQMYGAVETFDARRVDEYGVTNYVGALGRLTQRQMYDLREACKGNSPTMLYLDMTYGEGSANMFLFVVLKSMFTLLGVDGSKMADFQIDDLANSIKQENKDLNVDEIKVFVSRFKQARYKQFYGDTTYYLAIMKSLQKFREERAQMLDTIRSEEMAQKEAEAKRDGISREEYCKRHGIKEDEAPLKNFGLIAKKKKRDIPQDLKIKMAEGIVGEKKERIKETLSNVFRDKFGVTPEDFLKTIQR